MSCTTSAAVQPVVSDDVLDVYDLGPSGALQLPKDERKGLLLVQPGLVLQVGPGALVGVMHDFCSRPTRRFRR